MKREEDQLQMECVRWFKLQYPKVVIIHSKNEGNRKSIVMKRNGKSYSPDGNRNKKMGVLAGTPDLFIMKSYYMPEMRLEGVKWIHGKETYYNGLWIEMKAPGRGQTDEQKDFEAKAKQEGYAYEVCKSVDEFIKIVNEYLN